MLDVSFDRFKAPERSLTVIGICPCGCREEIHFQDEGVWQYDGDKFVNAEHFARWSGAERMDVEWA